MEQDILPGIIAWHQEFRTSIFTSSLTLGTFLFTMKTFMIQTIKKEIYDTSEYQDNIRKRLINGQSNVGYYSPLKRLSRLITASILLAIVNACLQITIGYVERSWVSWLCLTTTLLSWGLVASVLMMVSKNMIEMLEISERKIDK